MEARIIRYLWLASLTVAFGPILIYSVLSSYGYQIDIGSGRDSEKFSRLMFLYVPIGALVAFIGASLLTEGKRNWKTAMIVVAWIPYTLALSFYSNLRQYDELKSYREGLEMEAYRKQTKSKNET